MNINHKLVLKGTAKISLHERFTQLSKFQVTEDNHHDYDRGHDRGGQSLGGGGVSRYGRGASASYPRDLSPQIQRPRPSSLPFNMDRERLWRPSAAVTAAAKLKRKSIQQRLGVKARLTMPRYRPGAGLARWGSTDSINSNNMGSRRWTGFRRRRGGYLNRGFGRWGGFRNRNRWGQGRRGRGRGGGGRWRRGGRRQGPPPSREQLDQEIDTYMAGTKTVLDKQLDDYMMEAANV